MGKYTERSSLPPYLRIWAETNHLGEDEPHYAFFTEGHLALYVGIGPDTEDPQKIVASSYIEKQPEADNPTRRSKTPTTSAYKRAVAFMQAWASTNNTPLDYLFETSSPTLIEWARHNGERVFGPTWQVEADKPKLFVGRATFSPVPRRR